MAHPIKTLLSISTLILLSVSAYADSVTPAPATTTADAASDSTTELAAKGIWEDPKTKLMWFRCSLGQTWDGEHCQGKASRLTWKEAKDAAAKADHAGYDDWRLPTVYELKDMQINTVTNPTQDQPFGLGKSDDNYGWYWSSSPYSYFGGSWAWALDLDVGKSDYIDKDRQIHAFVVRPHSHLIENHNKDTATAPVTTENAQTVSTPAQ